MTRSLGSVLRRTFVLAIGLACLGASPAPAAPVLTASPASATLGATDSTAITATMTGAANGTVVTFTPTNGTMDSATVPLTGGTAVDTFTSDTFAGRQVVVSALGQSATVTFPDVPAPPAVDEITHDDDGNLVGTIIQGDAPIASCYFTYTHDSGSPTRLDGTVGDDGNCTGGPIDGGITEGNWVIVLTVTDGNDDTVTGADAFTVSPADDTTDTTPPDDSSTTPPDTTPAVPVRVDADDALLTCEKSSIALTDVSVRDGRVRVLGVTTAANAGKSVHVAFSSASDVVASAKVAADGSFRATAKLPSHAIVNTDRARYRATLGTSVTPWLKLSRRLDVTGMHEVSSDLEVGGHIGKPLVKGAVVTVTSQSDCTAAPVVIGHVPVASDGTFYRVIAIPETVTGFVVRLTAKVRTPDGSETNTYSIARPIQIR